MTELSDAAGRIGEGLQPVVHALDAVWAPLAGALAVAIRDYKIAKQAEADAVAAEDAARIKLEETLEWRRHAGLHEQRVCSSAGVSSADDALRAAALAVYAGDKKVAPGVEIRDFPKVKYDADKALAWALAHQPKLAKLDARAFEQVVLANAGGPIEIVPADVATVEVEHRVFITASKL